MNRSLIFVALCGLALASAGGATGALAVEPEELAAPGVCATAHRELRQGPVTSEAVDASDAGGSETLASAGSAAGATSTGAGVTSSAGPAPTGGNTAGGNAAGGVTAGGSTATGAPRVHLTPIQVAASPIPFSGPRPLPQAFSGPGACDQPGSGCQGQVLPAASGPVFVDPPPAGGCNFPGCILP